MYKMIHSNFYLILLFLHKTTRTPSAQNRKETMAERDCSFWIRLCVRVCEWIVKKDSLIFLRCLFIFIIYNMQVIPDHSGPLMWTPSLGRENVFYNVNVYDDDFSVHLSVCICDKY